MERKKVMLQEQTGLASIWQVLEFCMGCFCYDSSSSFTILYRLSKAGHFEKRFIQPKKKIEIQISIESMEITLMSTQWVLYILWSMGKSRSHNLLHAQRLSLNTMMYCQSEVSYRTTVSWFYNPIMADLTMKNNWLPWSAVWHPPKVQATYSGVQLVHEEK